MAYRPLTIGKSYSLCDLFSENRKIIIPDLQRDYCWGNDDHAENFIMNLIENVEKEQISLGLLYGYEYPTQYIQLCDGQQRITTLFLLIGMMNRKYENNKLKKFLISEEEMDDDFDPYLQYSIRESTLYFLSDLTRYFFIENAINCVADIKKQTWYFEEYNLDPSIQSMLKTMSVCENILKDMEQSVLDPFCSLIVEKISFLYYDMGDAQKGEETFVVINTTGEMLSATENLKPLLVSKDNENRDQNAHFWEEMETFFWKIRSDDTDTADDGLECFFRCILLIKFDERKDILQKKHLDKYCYELLLKFDFNELKEYFSIVKRLFTSSKLFASTPWLPSLLGNSSRSSLSQLELFKRLPVIEYCHKFKEVSEKDIERIMRFFENQSLIDNVAKDIEHTLPAALKLIKDMTDKDVLSISKLENPLVSREVKQKCKILSEAKEKRMDIEQSFWSVEKKGIWKGEISRLLEWSYIDNSFSLEMFKEKEQNVINLLRCNDLFRRALLTIDNFNYPRHFSDNRRGYLCFAVSDNHWHELVNDSIDPFGQLMKKINFSTLQQSLNDVIEKGNNVKYVQFLENPAILEWCDGKCIDDLGNGEFLLIKNKIATNPIKMSDFLEQEQNLANIVAQ